MGDFIKSAFNFISNASSLKNYSNYTGKTLEVSGKQLKIKRLIAKGGFSLIYEASELSSNKSCAIKRILVQSSESQNVIYQEIKFMKMLTNHPHILEFFYAARIKSDTHEKMNEFLIVTELCALGDVSQFMPTPHSNYLLSMDNILKIFYQTSLAVEFLHNRSEKLIHRDLKIENLLISNQMMIKLCDFGSATTECHFPNSNWTLSERKALQEQMETVTTPMYRPPEIVDLFLNYPITETMDIWALGCILFYLTANFHPFEDSSKLAILNAKYSLPNRQNHSHNILESLISVMLLLDPTMRPGIQEVVTNVSEIAKVQGINPGEPLLRIKEKAFIYIGSSESVPERPKSSVKTPVGEVPPDEPSIKVEEVFEIFKNSAKDIFKNIKNGAKFTESDPSSKVPHRLKMITRRIGVMDYLSDERLAHYEMSILEKYPQGNYRVFNLSTKKYPSVTQFNGKYYDCCFDNSKVTRLDKTIEICLKALLFLNESNDNICFFQCDDGRNLCGFIVCCLFCLSKTFNNPSPAIQLFCSKSSNPHLKPSQIRYIDYVAKMSRTSREILPHYCAVKLKSIEISPIPIFNREKNGCRPYVRIYSKDQLLYTNLMRYHELIEFRVEYDSIRFNMKDLYAAGDLTFIVYHARSGHQDGSELDESVSSIKICEFRMSTFMLKKEMQHIKITKKYLDNLSDSNQMVGFTRRYADDFNVKLSVEICDWMYPLSDTLIFPWEFNSFDFESNLPFDSNDEYQSIMNDFGRFNISEENKHEQANDEYIPPTNQPSSDDDISKNERLSEENIFMKPSQASESSENKANEEDIFDVLNGRPKTAQDTKSTHKKENHSATTFSNDWFGFEGSCPSGEPPKSSTNTNPFFNLNDDDNDSFLNFESAKVFNGDIDDIFNNSTSKNSNFKTSPNTQQFKDGFSYSNPKTPSNNSYTDIPQSTRTNPPNSSRPSHNQSKNSDFFDDLLGDFKTRENGKPDSSKTVNELLKEKSRANLDPENKRVLEWSDGKQKNIRSLLCTLPNILWDGVKWNRITINDLLTPDQVKKNYKKAARVVHPDKWNNTEYENIAKLVFMELNEAMVEFEKL